MFSADESVAIQQEVTGGETVNLTPVDVNSVPLQLVSAKSGESANIKGARRVESETRKIIHMDMDAFYASVEQRDHPELRGRPLIVGGDPHSRGVVATCSYEARVFGIHSAMPSQTAYRLCPAAVFVRPRMDVYRDVSQEIMRIFKSFTELVEPLSLDEAYLDVTQHGEKPNSATLIAREIKKCIVTATGLTVSAGVSYNKFVAKMAYDYHKPDGLTVITPQEAQDFLDRLPVAKFHGVGKVTQERFEQIGVHTGSALRQQTLAELTTLFGDRGRYFYDLARGVDGRAVEPNRVRQSIGKETTMATDIENRAEMKEILKTLADAVEQSLRRRAVRARVVVLKIKFSDFTQITRRATVASTVQSADEIHACVSRLLTQVVLTGKVRLLGISVQKLEPDDTPHWVQLALF